MKKIFLIAFCTIAFLNCYGQDDPNIVGYYLKKKGNVIKVYQSKMDQGKIKDEPDISKFNLWDNESYWFQTDITVKVNNISYLRITIPNGQRWDPKLKSFVTSNSFTNVNAWTDNGLAIDAEDFNTWLWISQSDFDTYKENYYGRPKAQLVFSGITTPFKYRFKTGDHATSILNGDVNLGAYLGIRKIYLNNTLGINIGGILGVSSLPMNSSNNNSITDKSSQSVTGVNYGGAFVFDWQKKFQVGAVLGWDHAVGDLSKGYIYQDRMWIGVSLNFKFLDFGGSKDKTNQSSGTSAPAKAKS
ncbi:MAG TPA: hypothetical protein VJ844_12880 [Mucilaginibacter sp.]|nr:hypothetical protein [Mucilaginibacter sp.]